AVFGTGRGHQAGHVGPDDRRDHLEGRGIADTRPEEQPQEAGKEYLEIGGATESAGSAQNAKDTDYQGAKGDLGGVLTAPSVRNPARQGARQGADQRPEEGQLQGIDVRKQCLGQERKGGGKADEGTEG